MGAELWPRCPSEGSVTMADTRPVATTADRRNGASSVGAISCLESAYTREHDLPVAPLANASGADVQPTSDNVAAALRRPPSIPT